MKLLRKVGSTSEIWQIFIADSSSTTGAGLTGLAFGTSGLTAYFHRDTDTTATAISLVTMTVGTFTSGGFKEIDATHMAGWYAFCPPDAALASGAKSCAFHLQGAANMAPLPIEVDLDAQVDVTFWKGTVVPNPQTAGVPDINAIAINNVATTSVTTINAVIGTATAGSTATAVASLQTTANTINTNTTGLVGVTFPATVASTTNITAGTITTVSGNVNGNVGGNVTGTVGSVVGAVGSVTGNVGGSVASVVGNVGGSVASVVGAVGSVTGNVGGSVASVVGAVGSVTGNVGGSVASVVGAVGSVTGAVGSVTGAVGSVTGNVGGTVASVVGAVGSVTGDVGGKVLGGGSGTISAVGAQVDLQTIKTRAITCSADVTILASIGTAATSTAQTGNGYAVLIDGTVGLSALLTAIHGVLTTQMTQSYAATGVAPTLAQAVQYLVQKATNIVQTGDKQSIKALDGTTEVAELTLNSATPPFTSTNRTD